MAEITFESLDQSINTDCTVSLPLFITKLEAKINCTYSQQSEVTARKAVY